MMSAIDDNPVLSLRTVVYATDFSPCSRNAGLYAAQMATYFSAQLFVAHAFTYSQAAMEVEAGNRKVSQQRIDLNRLLLRETHLLGTNSHEAIPALLEGEPKIAIAQLADRNSPSIIVLGTHGGGRLERGIIGSVAEEILRSTHWPALTVGPQVQAASAKTLPFKRILFVTDFTPTAALATAYVVELADMFGASIDVLNVVHDDVIESHKPLDDLRNHFLEIIDGLVSQHAKAFCDPKTFVATGCAHDRIIEHLRDKSIDLLVLSIRKTSHLSIEMRTSGVFRIIVDAQCPVLTIRR